MKNEKISRVIIIVCLFLSASIAQEQTKYGLGFEFHTFPSAFMMGEGGDPWEYMYLLKLVHCSLNP